MSTKKLAAPEMIKKRIKELEVTEEECAKGSAMHPAHFRKILLGKLSISPRMAILIGGFLEIDPMSILMAQTREKLIKAYDELKKEGLV